MEVLASRYEVLRTVSEGRRASVVQALDRQHERLVALKVYPVTSDADRAELLAEARLLLSVSHPALPAVRGDFFTDDDRYVVVMDWVDGTDLEEVLDDEGDPGLPLPQVIDVVTQVAAALDYLHGHEPPIVHGDVKPANLVRTPAGRIVLVDFDIAGAHAARGRVGTRGFAAPEVAAGEKPGPPADVYGLAATVFTLLNGEPPSEGDPHWPGIDPAEAAALARAVRGALSIDPNSRPSSAGKFVEGLRRFRRADLPTGMVALLATEVADAGRLWDEDADEMRAATARFADLLAQVVESRGGRVVTSMDRSISVFAEESSAARAALALQDALESDSVSSSVDVRLRVAIEVGETELVDGVYTGAAVDRVQWLGSVAAPGAIITSEATAELLIGRLDDNVSIIPLGKVVTRSRPRGVSVCALARTGREHTARVETEQTEMPNATAELAFARARPARGALVAEALEHPATLTALTVAGFALIYLTVLGSELGQRGIAVIVFMLATATTLVSFGRRYLIGYHEDEARREIAEFERTRAETLRMRDESFADLRRALGRGFSRIGSADGSRVLDGLTHEWDAVSALLQRSTDAASLVTSSLLPGLAEETYRSGLSTLSKALELLEVADGPERRRLEREVAAITERSEDPSGDARERERDEQRKVSHEKRLAALDELHQHGRELLFEAERCEATLHQARIELTSMRAGSAQVSVDVVVQTLEENIRRVREVQDEMRRLGY